MGSAERGAQRGVERGPRLAVAHGVVVSEGDGAVGEHEEAPKRGVWRVLDRLGEEAFERALERVCARGREEGHNFGEVDGGKAEPDRRRGRHRELRSEDWMGVDDDLERWIEERFGEREARGMFIACDGNDPR